MHVTVMKRTMRYIRHEARPQIALRTFFQRSNLPISHPPTAADSTAFCTATRIYREREEHKSLMFLLLTVACPAALTTSLLTDALDFSPSLNALNSF
jgi:hypothetical protein